MKQARIASKALEQINDSKNRQVLETFSTLLRTYQNKLLQANQLDLKAMPPEDPRYDRLLLNETRLKSIARDIEAVAQLPSPCGILLEEKLRPNGLHIQRVSVPLGVVGMIYEARPNVTADAFALCFRSSNACILKGGSEAKHSNQAIVDLAHQALRTHQLNESLLILLPPDRSSTQALLEARDHVDVVIPRGSQQLINYVREHARVPIIETGAGVVHTYFDKDADFKKGQAIIDNAKTRRVSVCNALDTLIIHKNRLSELPSLIEPLLQKGVEICEDYGQEFLSLKMSIKMVSSLEEALDHIEHYGSKHSEAIITENTQTAQTFLNRVDAAAVYVNASTAFTDGGEFGLGAEIGISTQKLHARGPFALQALTTYKWIIRGNGQIRPV